MEFKMFKKIKLQNLILDRFKIINGIVCRMCVNDGKTFKANNYKFFLL
ncbi:hypothetical protein AAJ76_1290001726 [Vairimorpha ceranae]|uniref:Uncharacterized protein n=1 Tax=Vairimorpha ceranae TaxID=40302 RepID=A0A0F9WLU3_9MICR|nr:hypothetical protein AAJ76_1290001726 [Vairimorpha ceranae]KKO74048.1 hypothetical protein AAJ76_1290001726 [Vairimorpha ceranae]